MVLSPSFGKCALVIGHPGHELRIHHWLEMATPLTFVLTDGSGGDAEARIESTSQVLTETGSRRGSIYGPFADRDFYKLIMNRRYEAILQILDELVLQFEAHGIETVVGDACEGYSPTHDACRLLLGAAARITGHRRGQSLNCYDFGLVGAPRTQNADVRIALSEDAFGRKMASAYEYTALRKELETVKREIGLDAFRVECLQRVCENESKVVPPSLPPFYESYGEQQVACGRYHQVIRYQHHMAPLADVVREYTEQLLKRGLGASRLPFFVTA